MNLSATQQILDEVLKSRNVTYQPEHRILQDLNIDSIEVISLIVEIEQKIGCELDDETYLTVLEGTICEITEAIERLLAAQSQG
ncbi:acyl carrier protein [Croceifilum oryzae]|uniref:Acyl carrier protein n=1 Tax=Croceifilum oryzae TaxID=1553429 RepID=A0AAJ1WT16_9BACL|nr:phosphopantetheine-binding protein [Croceifilum oryzae]MDQ0417968.1 acyl carrier protein [Croceifilum oryzae]